MQPTNLATAIPGVYRPILASAILAPSGHNTQPWKFSVQGQTIRIFPDKRRSLAVVDPDDRELYISLGCALENLVIAAAHSGFAGEVTYFPEEQPECLQVELSPAAASSDPLFEAIQRRQSTRRLYDGRPVPNGDLDRLNGLALGRGIAVQLFTSTKAFEPLVEWVKAGDRSQYADPAFIDELITWMRFNDGEAAKYGDGLSTKCTGNPSMPRWVGKIALRLLSPESYANKDEKMMRSSSGMALFVAENNDKAAWVDTGRAFERFALTATHLGLKLALLNQPVEVPAVRAQIQSALNLGTAQAQLLARYGYGGEMPRSLRRPFEQALA